MANSFTYKTKFGDITIVEDNNSIVEITFSTPVTDICEHKETNLLKCAHKQLEEYFSGKRKIFDLPLSPQGTEFQKKVWNALTKIPYGCTCSYKDIAISIGNEKACRAVGNANNKNPIFIIIPCHRVIGANGSLVGYGGGLDLKKKLLDLEKQQ